ncbi:MAG: glutamine amidotransferase [Chromatiales bacterium]|nr:glutamine amidotransferase [Chromatiales bacterium]
MNPTHLIIKAGTKLPSLSAINGDYEEWMADILKWRREDYRTVAVYQGELLPPMDEVKSVIITGADSMVADDAPWIATTAEWLAQAIKLKRPILGICFGHQLLAHALGGRVGNNPCGVEVGTVTIHLTDSAKTDTLFGSLPDQFSANVSHQQSVLELPTGAHLLAYSELEPVHAFSYGGHAWGIQFHPEFDRTAMTHFIHYYANQIKGREPHFDALSEQAADTPISRALLRNFALLQQNLA